MNALEYNLIHRFNVGDALRRSAARTPLQRAVHFQGRELTYAELEALANRIAGLLMENGIGRGDAVAIFATNSPEYVATFFGCARIGAVLVPINLMFTTEDVGYVLEKTRVKALLIEPTFQAKVSKAPVVQFVIDEQFRTGLAARDASPVEQFVAADDPHLIIFTSGTTAKPKGVVLTHLNFYSYLIATYADYGADRGTRYLLALPMFHVAGLVMTFNCFASGCDSVVIPLPKPDLIIHAIAVQKVNTIALPATVWVGLISMPLIEAVDLSSLKRLFVFQYLPTPVFQRWRRLTPHAEWINCWGQTETTALGSTTPAGDLERMLAAPDPIGVSHLPLELRNVSSQEVEEAIAQHPGVAEVAVIGLHDPYWIEKVVACVVPAPGAQLSEDSLLAHARSRLANFKVPKQIHVMAEFPKNPTGKVLKRVLRERLENGAGAAS